MEGITPNAERTRDMVLNSLGIVTLLKPVLGYELRRDRARGLSPETSSLRQIVVEERRLLTPGALGRDLFVRNLIRPEFEQ